jgi:sacsin
MEYVFKNASPSATWYKRLESVPFVAVEGRKGNPSNKRLKPTQVIDKTAAIAELYFDDEAVFAARIYRTTHILQLRLLGMKNGLDSEVVDNRIRKYVTRKDGGVRAKCESLLQFLSDHGSSVTFKPEWTGLIRMPAMSPAGKKVILPPSKCRPNSLKPLVEGVLAIVSTHVKEALYKELGWNDTLDPDVLGERINVIANKSKESSSAERSLRPVFDYIKSRVGEGLLLEDYIEKMTSKIAVAQYLPGSIVGLWSPNDLYFQNARDFEPYLSNIPLYYCRSFRDILKLLGVTDQPSSESLLCVLSKLPTDQPLDDTDLNVAINILRHFSALPAADTAQLLAPSIDGHLYRINEFTSPHTSKHLFAHPKVPAAVSFKFNIPQVGDDTAFIHHLKQTDVFDDYCQEELITNRIANTLKEYSLSTSFNEFIANAEDCGSATQVTWCLDSEDSLFPTDSLFSKELSSWQTPSLYVYNDGVFSEHDFKAFINTGGGSKADDPTKIGKYGLGSLTMYHFTDIPSLISGEYFVIFDPSRKHLPLSKGRTRAGLRVPLSMMKAKFKDHLVPFVGIGGYTLGTTP